MSRKRSSGWLRRYARRVRKRLLPAHEATRLEAAGHVERIDEP